MNMTAILLYMLKMYVDDTNLAMAELEPGTRYVNGELVIIEKEVEADSRLSGDHRTSEVIQTVDNSISWSWVSSQLWGSTCTLSMGR